MISAETQFQGTVQVSGSSVIFPEEEIGKFRQLECSLILVPVMFSF